MLKVISGASILAGKFAGLGKHDQNPEGYQFKHLRT